MGEFIRSLIIGDKFALTVAGERNGCLRLLGDFANQTGLTLRADEVAVLRWHNGQAELVIERRPGPDAAAVASPDEGTGTPQLDAA
jgi:hypothetical protein